MASLRHRRGIAEAEDYDDGSGTAPDTSMTGTEEEEEDEEDEEQQEEEEDHRLRLGLHSMTAKGIQHLCSELLEIKKASEQDFRANVYVSYLSFVRMFQEAGDLDKDVQRLRRQAIAHGRLVQHLSSSLHYSSSSLLAAAASGGSSSMGEAEDMEDMDMKDDNADDEDELVDVLLSSEQLEQLLRRRRAPPQQEAAERLASVAGNPRTPRAELLRAVSGLCRLGDPERANRLLLDWYRARVVRGVEELRATHQSQSHSGGNYIKEVARLVLSSIAQASRSLLMHGHGQQQQQLLRWAREEMEDFGGAFAEYVVSIPVVSQQLALALEAAECAVSYASQLSLADDIGVLGLMAPSIREALAAYATHLKEVVRLLVASDTWVLGRFRLPAAGDCLLTASGRKLVTLLQEVAHDVASPLQRLGMDSAATQLVADLFREYVVRCSMSIPASDLLLMNSRSSNNNLEEVSILINCATLASLFPTIASTAAAAAAQREAAAQVWDCFCHQFVRDTMMGMASDSQEEGMPSLGLQVVFLRVRRLKDAYGAILSGEDGTMKRLLRELMEAIVSWLSANMSWRSAHQAHLDVHFLLQIAQLGGVDITDSAMLLLRKDHHKEEADHASWAADAARHAVQLLSLHNTTTTTTTADNAEVAVVEDDDMASRKSSDEFISIEDDDDQENKAVMLNNKLVVLGQQQSSDNDDAIHDDDDRASPPPPAVAAAETAGGRSRKKKAAVSTSSRPRWQR